MVDGNITIIKTGLFMASSTMMSNMLIFNDSFYLQLIILGIAISLMGLVHELLESDIPRSRYKVLGDMIKVSFLGGVLTPIFFIVLNKYIHYSSDVIYCISLVFAWYSTILWKRIELLIIIIGNKATNRVIEIIFKKVNKYE